MTFLGPGGAPCLAVLPFGFKMRNQYVIHNDCLDALDDLNFKITRDGKSHNLRRGFSQTEVFTEDLIPLLSASKDAQPIVFRSTLKFLMNLTTPVQCFVGPQTIFSQDPDTQFMLFELKQLLYKAKETLANRKTIDIVLGFVKSLLRKKNREMDLGDVDCINETLLLIRNLLDAPYRPTAPKIVELDNDGEGTADGTDVHRYQYDGTNHFNRTLIAALFANQFDGVLIHLMRHPKKESWAISIVQLMGLFYKNQPVEDLKKILDQQIANRPNFYYSFEKDLGNVDSKMTEERNDLSTSSDETSGYSSKINEFDGNHSPGSSQSCSNQTRMDGILNTSSSGFYSGNSSCSPSSDIRQKMLTKQHAAKNRRISKSRHDRNVSRNAWMKKRIIQMDKSNTLLVTAESQCRLENVSTPTVSTPDSEGDVALLLTKFTIGFLQQGYNPLVSQLHQTISEDDQQQSNKFDRSYFLWLITYFLGLTSHLEMDFEIFGDIFTTPVLQSIANQTVCETKQWAVQKSNHRLRLRLGVTAIREFLQTMELHSDRYDSMEKIKKLRLDLIEMKELRQVFLLQLSQIEPKNDQLTRGFLSDVITSNHSLLLSLDKAIRQSEPPITSDMVSHLKQFVNGAIIDKYRMALTKFRSNSQSVNDSIFTMLHRVGLELGGMNLLTNTKMVRTFINIWKQEEFDLNDHWNDLIEVILQQFLNNFNNENPEESSISSVSDFGFDLSPSTPETGKNTERLHFLLETSMFCTEKNDSRKRNHLESADDTDSPVERLVRSGDWTSVSPEDLPDHFFLSQRKFWK